MSITKAHLDWAVDYIISVVTTNDTDKSRDIVKKFLVETNIVDVDDEPIMHDAVSYNGREWPVVNVYVPRYGYQKIGTESLSVQLDFNDSAARDIDESIFFYAPDKYINDPSLGDLVEGWLRDKR